MRSILCTLLFVALLGMQVHAQRVVTGVVTSANDGTTIPGVTVLVKGTMVGTVTDLDGSYSITIPDGGQVLQFSYVGMRTQEVPIGSLSVIDVSMEMEAIGMDEIIVIGYASTRQQDLSVAVSTVKVDESYKGRPSNIGTMIQGEMTGVRVVQTGDPRSGADISIRGRGNRGGDGVLYVVDGVPGAPYNPADIETITVLKDAASSAIYGAYAGSGGVVIITTKQAKEGAVGVEANAWHGVQNAWRLPEVLTQEQFNMVWADASRAAGRNIPAAYDPLQFPYGNVTRTDWIDAIFRPGYMQHYDVSIRGGSDMTKAFASLSYDDTQGVLINTYDKRLNARVNLQMKPAEWVTLTQNMLYHHNNGQSNIGSGHTGAVFAAMAYPRFATVYEYDDFGNKLPGGTVPRWALAEGFSVEADLFNPVTQLENTRQNNPYNRLFSTTSLEIKPIDGLSVKSEFSYDVASGRYENFTARFTAPGRTVDENYRRISNSLNNSWNWENIVSYSRIFDDKHYVSVLGGFTMNYLTSRSNITNTRGYSFEHEFYTVFENAGDWSYSKPDESIWQESTVSALGRASYSFDDRYFFTASVRRDASSKLAPSNNADVFPAFSAAWKLTSEEFMSNFDQISILKLRGSWGQVGNIRSVRRFIYAPPFRLGDYGVFLGDNMSNHVFGLYQPTIANPDLRWERTEQTNVGLDVGLFRNSLSFTVDYFYKLTKDLIETMPIPSVAGVTSPPEVNIGEVENYGWEFSLSYNKQVGEVDLNVRGNFGTVKNNVINIGERDFIAHSNTINAMQPLQSTIGQPWYSYYLIEAAGIFKTQAEIDAYTWSDPASGQAVKIQPNARPGDIKYIDFNNDGRINDGDRQYMGAYDYPDLSYGLNLGASWRNFSVNMFWQGIAGVKVFNGVKAMSSAGLKGWNMSTDILESFEYDPNSGVPRLSFIDDPNGNYSLVSSYFLEDGDYLRLRNLSLSYTIPQVVMSRLGLGSGSTVRVYANGENLLTFTKYSAFDPEVGNLGMDGGRFPISRIYSFGINVSF